MTLITTYDQCYALVEGDKLKRIIKEESTNYQVHENNTFGLIVDLFLFPLITPRIVTDGVTTVYNNTEISGGFPIHRTYEELVDKTWYIL